jgi:PAS domain S-box-containing protein
MKKILFSIWQIKPLNWIRRVRGFKLVYTPFIAIVIFTGVMAAILGTLQFQEKTQQESALYSELSIARQRIQLRFESNTDMLMAITRDYVANADNLKLKEKAIFDGQNLLDKNIELVEIFWINQARQVEWKMPVGVSKSDWINRSTNAKEIYKILSGTIRLSDVLNRPVFSNFFTIELPDDESVVIKNRNVFWQAIPSNGEAGGTLVALYSTQAILDIIPSELKGQYRFTLLAENDKVLAISSDKNIPKRAYSHQSSLDLGELSPGFSLRIDSYPPASNLTFRMLIGVVLGLSAFVIWSLWSVLKQMQVRQEAEANLRTETNFRNAMENSTPVGIRAHDMNKAITYVNRTFCEMTGLTAKELIGLTPPFPFWPDNKKDELTEKIDQALSLALTNEGKTGIEGAILHRDGSRIETRTFIAPLINEKGEQTGWVTSLVDISEPKKIREELAASQDRFITVLEGLDAAVSVISLENGDLLFANRFYQERFGDDPKGHMNLANDDRTESIDSEEIELIDEATSKSTWYEVRRRSIPWVDGHLAQLLIATDITIRIEGDELNRQQEEKMQFSSRLTTMGEMASSLAHELNQPLAAISNYCMGVAKRLKNNLDPEVQETILPALEKASNQAHRAGTIIQRIRSFVKRSEPQSKPTDITEIINDAVGLVEIEAHRYRFSISSEVAEGLPKVDLDPILILQVLVNLLKNSLDSMKEIYPLSSRWSAPPVKISADLDTSSFPAMLRIQVTDSGSGIADSVIERMFEPFYSTKNDGMGMGLNICRSVIESHQGRLWAKNHLDVEQTKRIGCTFTILLPLEFPATKEAA